MKKEFLSKLMLVTVLAAVGIIFNACKKEDGNNGSARISITDGPSDDVQVKSVFVTVADVKIDGKSWSGFKGKTTLDLMTLQKGQTSLLGEGELSAKSYSNIVLVLDTETDASGNAPGCYVKDAQNVKHKLEGGAQKSIDIAGDFTAAANSTTDLVIDFDLRKTLTYNSGGTSSYAFVSDGELSSGIRLVEKPKTGTINGNCNKGTVATDKVVVYAYKKGTFNLSTEKQPQGASQIQFKNAITSSTVANDGSFTLSFLESGEYELHFIGYEDTNNDGKMEAKGHLQVNVLNELNILGLNLTTSGSLTVNVLAVAVVPI